MSISIIRRLLEHLRRWRSRRQYRKTPRTIADIEHEMDGLCPAKDGPFRCGLLKGHDGEHRF